jgi:dipeptidyl aminopeptidase/acylaminoacyl peptidase
MPRPVIRMLLFAVIALAATSLLAATVDPKPYFRNPDIHQVALSPSGEYLAILAPANGRIALTVTPIAKRDPKVIAVVDGYDIAQVNWVNDNRLVFNVYDGQSGLGEQYGGGLFAVDRDGSNSRMLVPNLLAQVDSGAWHVHLLRLMQTLRDGSDDVLVVGSETNFRSLDVYRMNTRNGRKTLLTLDRPGDAEGWVADPDGNVRGALTIEKATIERAWWRRSADAKWEMIGEYKLGDARTYPVAFDGDGSMIVASNVDRDTFALFRWDAKANARGDMLAGYARADIDGGTVFDRSRNRIVGVYYDAELPGAVWFDEDVAKIAAAVDKALPGHVNLLQRGVAERYLVTSVSDVDPGSYYLLDLKSRSLESLGVARPDLRDLPMPHRKPIRYKARDGLEIPAFLTLPIGRDAKNLPLIMLVHGGPNVRGTHWQWNPEAAYLAALGYAVLEPDYRGSTGWGMKLFHAGWKQWGRSMQDDLNDGMDDLVRQGIVDARRACIMGASYGGYAVMEGLARDPDRWRCGVNYVGVTDILMMNDVTWSDFADSDYLKYGFQELVGDPDKDAAMLKAASPLLHASSIKAPVLMTYGGLDTRVPVVHGERMRDALEKQGTTVDWTVYPQEGHGFLLESNRFDFYSRVAAFLARYLPPNP